MMTNTHKALRLLLLTVPVLLLALGLAGCGSDNNSSALPGTAAQQAALTTAVHTAAQGLAAVAVHDGTHDLETIKAYVHAVRFLDDQSGYFFVYDYTNNYCVAHAILTAWEGTDKSDYRDPHGLYPVQEFSKMARDAGLGFLVFHFNNPTTGTEQMKLGYMEVIPGTTLYLGSGIYVGG